MGSKLNLHGDQSRPAVRRQPVLVDIQVRQLHSGPGITFLRRPNLPAQYGKGAQGFVADGLSTRNAPKWTLNTSTDYDIHLGSYGVLTPGFDLNYVDDYRTWYDPNPWAVQPAYWKLNARLVWTAPSSGWYATFFVTNATNKTIELFSTPNQGGIIYNQYADPRIYGVRVNYRL